MRVLSRNRFEHNSGPPRPGLIPAQRLTCRLLVIWIGYMDGDDAAREVAFEFSLPGMIATTTPAKMVAIPRMAIGVTVSWRNARPSAKATIGMISVLKMTTVASIFLIK